VPVHKLSEAFSGWSARSSDIGALACQTATANKQQKGIVMLNVHPTPDHAHVARSTATVASPLKRTLAPGERFQRGIWQLGVELFCAATGAKSGGVVVLYNGAAGARVVAELGRAMHGRIAWLHDTSAPHAGRPSGGAVCDWQRIVVVPQELGDEPHPAQYCLWGCKLIDVGGYCAYMGLECDGPLTDQALRQVVTLGKQFARALKMDLCLPTPEPESPGPIALAHLAASRFALTEAESLVLSEMMSGTPAKRIASRRNVSVSTVRSQIKSIYGKLDIHRASQIYSRLHQPAAAMRN
jgi:DNA-binding CsgD family transcriptional regulator